MQSSSEPSLIPVSIPWWGRISTLWLLFVPLCITIYSLMLPLGPNDFWYHARAGRVIAETGRIPRGITIEIDPEAGAGSTIERARDGALAARDGDTA